MSLPPIEALASSPDLIQPVLDTLFEPSSALYSVVAARLPQSFGSYDEFIDFVSSLLRSLDDSKRLLDILGAHPRLGAKTVDSVHSQAEQKSLTGGEEAEDLDQLNGEYEKAFPGMKYVAFVAGRSGPVIVQNMKERIARGDIEAEKKEAIEAMCDIAKDRASKLL